MRIPYTTMIDRLGQYKTRNGRLVRIDRIVPGSSFPCKGHILKTDSIGRIRRTYGTWALNGCYRATAGSGLDVIAYVGE